MQSNMPQVPDTREQLEARIVELERLNDECRKRELRALDFRYDVLQIVYAEGNGVEILCANPEADEIDKQCAVRASGDFTDYEPVMYWGETTEDAVKKAADACRQYCETWGE